MKKKQLACFLVPKIYLKRALLAGMLALPMSITTVYATSHPSLFEQQISINLSFKNERIGVILDEISKQSKIKLTYSNEQVPTEKKVSVNIHTTDIKEALTAVLGTNYSFRQIDDYISISKNKEIPQTSQQQQGSKSKKAITGLITDADGNPIIGATVQVKGTTNGVISDIDGRYTLKDVKDGDVVAYRYIGYNDEEKTIKNGLDVINIRLTESSISLKDVVVIGYGQQKKSSVVSSLNSIGPAELTGTQRNLRNSIAGHVPGVIAVQRSGEPGNDAAAFYIRGISSYQGGTSPLVLVDGVPRSMDDIDVDEIESFTVLKDASATAVYGAEGANGVVLITSKRGVSQKTTVNVNAQYSVITPTRVIELMDSYNYLKLYNEAQWNDAGNPNRDSFLYETSNELLEKYRTGTDPDIYPNAIWTDLLKAHTQSQRYTINLRGGSEKVRFFASGAYYSEDGIYKSDAKDNYDANVGLQRFNLRSNVDMDITKTTLLSIDMSGQYLRKNYPGFSSDDIFSYISHYPTHIIPMYYSDGSFSDHTASGWGIENQPYNMLNNSGYTKQWNAFLQTKVTLNQKLDIITQGLSVKGVVSFDSEFSSSVSRTKTPETYFASSRNPETNELIKIKRKNGSALGDPGSPSTWGKKNIYLEASLNYQRTFSEKHDVTGMLLYMQKESQSQEQAGLKALPYRKQSFVARGTYGYDNRYMLEASMGMTGSENFAPGHRWGAFPAVGVAWYASHEKFMKPLESVISKLKFRATYGITGNDNLNEDTRFPYRESINSSGGYSFGLSPGVGGGATNSTGNSLVEGAFARPNLTWEIEKKLNVGVDLGLFDGRVDLSADYFYNRRSNILLQRETVSQVSGFRVLPFQNYGITVNRGIDGNITLKQNIGEVHLSAVGNFTYAKNKIVEKDEVEPRYPYMQYTGHSIGTPYLYIAEGLYTPDDFNITTDPGTGKQTYELKDGLPKPAAKVSPGDVKYKDLNGDDEIDGDDRTYNHDLYSQNPEIVYGFGLNIEWRGFFVGVFFQGAAHSSVNLIANQSNIIPFSIGKDKQSARMEALDRWTADSPYNQEVTFPRMHMATYDNNVLPSTWWYRDAGFLRLKNVEIGYEFKKQLIQKLKMNNLRVYVQGNNLALWDKVKFWDPELDMNTSGAKYPLNRTITLGLEVTF